MGEENGFLILECSHVPSFPPLLLLPSGLVWCSKHPLVLCHGMPLQGRGQEWGCCSRQELS